MMRQTLKIEVEVLFYDSGKGSRKTSPLLSGNFYRPHFVVKGTETYLGISFFSGELAVLGKKTNAVAALMYDTVDYRELLNSNTEFLIKEGPNTVGEGKVIKVN